jgi:hypothetical protein
MATAGPTTATSAHRRTLATQRAILTAAALSRKHRQQSTYFFTLAFHTDHIICLLMANQQFKLILAI